MKKCRLMFKYLAISFLGSSILLQDLHARGISKEFIEQLKLVDNSLKVKSSKDCGKIYALKEGMSELVQCNPDQAEFLAYSGEQHFPTFRKFPRFKKQVSDVPDFRTRQAQVFVHLPANVKANAKNVEKVIDELFASELKKKVEERFEKEVRLAKMAQNEKLLEYVESTRKLLFQDFANKPSNLIKTFLTLYPDLVAEIEKEAGSDLRPLLCRYELTKHRVKLIKKWSNVFLVLALGLGVSAIVVSSMGMAIPALAISAATAAVIVGAKDVGLGLYNINVKEKAGNVAYQLAHIAYEIKKTVKNLEEKKSKLAKEQKSLTPDEETLLSVLQEIEEDISKGRRKKLKKIHRAKHINRIMIACGILNAGFNGVNFSGDPQILAKLPETLLNLIRGN